jgi:putative hydrolase of HD superfamily
MLPADQRAIFRALWDEFEARRTPEACVANALDRFQALLLNSHSGGGSWATHRVRRSQVLARMAPVQSALPSLWPYVLEVIDRACETGAIVRD